MKLYFDGITRNTENPVVIAELKKAGYKEVVESQPIETKAEEAEPKKAGK